MFHTSPDTGNDGQTYTLPITHARTCNCVYYVNLLKLLHVEAMDTVSRRQQQQSVREKRKKNHDFPRTTLFRALGVVAAASAFLHNVAT